MNRVCTNEIPLIWICVFCSRGFNGLLLRVMQNVMLVDIFYGYSIADAFFCTPRKIDDDSIFNFPIDPNCRWSFEQYWSFFFICRRRFNPWIPSWSSSLPRFVYTLFCAMTAVVLTVRRVIIQIPLTTIWSNSLHWGTKTKTIFNSV